MVPLKEENKNIKEFRIQNEQGDTSSDEEKGLALKKKYGTYAKMFEDFGFSKDAIKVKMFDWKKDFKGRFDDPYNLLGFVENEAEGKPRGYIPPDYKNVINININAGRSEGEKWATIAHELEHLLDNAKGFESADTKEGHFANVKHFTSKRPKDTDKIPKGIQSKLPNKKKGEK